MRAKYRDQQKLTYSEKLVRLRDRMRDPEWRRFGLIVLGGKALALAIMVVLIMGVPLLLGIIGGGSAHGQATMPSTQPAMAGVMPADLSDMTKNPTINPINTAWTLVAAFLVFGMQAGFTMLEAGFCRSQTVNVLVECIFDTCLCGFLYYTWGYAFMFGQGNGFIGWHDPNDVAGGPVNNWFFLQHVTAFTVYGGTGVPVLAHWVFQFAFADCASTICSGTMIGRTDFIGDILYSICVSGFIYPIIGHWAWGPDGCMQTMGGMNASPNAFTHFLPNFGMNFHDFAGSTVVHSIGGWIALAGGIMLGPRIGRKFKRDGGAPMLPHDLVMGVIGGFILWFGWYGFNPGSSLSAMDFGGIGRISANTTLAACTAGLSAELFMYFRTKKWDCAAITNGFLAGLVAITCPCYWVSPTALCILGAIAGIIVILGVDLLEFVRIDDPIGAWPVHGLCGVWGTLSLGLFACGQYSAAGSSPTGIPVIDPAANPALTGLFYGGGAKVFFAQCIGAFCIDGATFVCAMTVFGVLHAFNRLRITKHGELEGLDLHEHGMSAYPEYVISALVAPQGMSRDTVGLLPEAGDSAAPEYSYAAMAGKK